MDGLMWLNEWVGVWVEERLDEWLGWIGWGNDWFDE